MTLHHHQFRGQCPHCERPTVRTWGEEPGAAAIGDVIVCTGCEKLSIVDHNLRLRPLTKERLARLQRSEFWPQVERMQQAVRRAKEARLGQQKIEGKESG